MASSQCTGRKQSPKIDKRYAPAKDFEVRWGDIIRPLGVCYKQDGAINYMESTESECASKSCNNVIEEGRTFEPLGCSSSKNRRWCPFDTKEQWDPDMNMVHLRMCVHNIWHTTKNITGVICKRFSEDRFQPIHTQATLSSKKKRNKKRKIESQIKRKEPNNKVTIDLR